MRPLVAIAVSGLILGGVHAFLLLTGAYAPPAKQSRAPQLPQAEGVFSLDVTLTFDAAPDDFSLQPASLVVRLDEEEILRRQDALAIGTPITIERIDGIVTGENRFYVEANPAGGGPDVAHAVRVRVLRDGEPIVEKTLWSEPGSKVEGPLVVDVPRLIGERSQDEHAHD